MPHNCPATTTTNGTARNETERNDTKRHETTRNDTKRHDTARHETTRNDTTRHDTKLTRRPAGRDKSIPTLPNYPTSQLPNYPKTTQKLPKNCPKTTQKLPKTIYLPKNPQQKVRPAPQARRPGPASLGEEPGRHGAVHTIVHHHARAPAVRGGQEER